MEERRHCSWDLWISPFTTWIRPAIVSEITENSAYLKYVQLLQNSSGTYWEGFRFSSPLFLFPREAWNQTGPPRVTRDNPQNLGVNPLTLVHLESCRLVWCLGQWPCSAVPVLALPHRQEANLPPLLPPALILGPSWKVHYAWQTGVQIVLIVIQTQPPDKQQHHPEVRSKCTLLSSRPRN